MDLQVIASANKYLVRPEHKVKLDDFDPEDTSLAAGKGEAKKNSAALQRGSASSRSCSSPDGTERYRNFVVGSVVVDPMEALHLK